VEIDGGIKREVLALFLTGDGDVVAAHIVK
jgi:hypothetical protein